MVPMSKVVVAKFELEKTAGRLDEEILWTSIRKCLQADGDKFMKARNIKMIQRQRSKGGGNDD